MQSMLSLLGAAVVGEGALGRALPGDRRGCLLAYVGCDGGWVDRNRLALLLWPDADESSAKRNLRQLLLRVKRLALAPTLEVSAEAVRWPVPCDVADFRRALAAGDHARAVALYGGPFLDGFSAHDVGGMDAWVETERERLHAAFHGACMREAALAGAEGRFADADDRLRRLLELEPLAEDVVQAQVRLLARAGRREAALVVYERFARELREQLALEPLESTQELARTLARGAAVKDAPRSMTAPPLAAGRLSPPRLVARDAARRSAVAATTPVVVVAGEPGIGKTAFLRDLLPEALRTAAQEGLDGLPYHPLAALLRSRPALAARLGPYLEDLARLVPEIAPGLIPGPLDAATGKGRLAEALARMIESSGLPLVVDDLQWADAATLESIVYLATRGIRVYGTRRSGETGAALATTLRTLRSRALVTEIELGVLGQDDVRTLLADLMGRASGPPVFARWLWQRSGGNPMFALESLRALFEAGVLQADERGWHTEVDDLTHDYGELDVPPAVSEVIDRRLSRLGAATIRVLEAAAVAQTGFDPRFLASVTGLSITAVAEGIAEATAAGFIEGAGFRHDLLRQTLHRGIERVRLQVLHELVARALEGQAEPGIVAEHWWSAGSAPQARRAWLAQSRALRSRGLHEDAVAALRAAAERLPRGDDRAWLRLALADALRESDRPDEAEDLIRAVEQEEGHATAPASLRLAAVLARGALLLHRGWAQEAKALLDATRGLASVVDDAELLLDDVMLRARVAKELVRAHEAAELLEPVVARLRRGRRDLRFVQFVTSLASLYDDVGRHDDALPLHTEALTLARALGARYQQVEASINLLFCYADLGRHDDAVPLAEEALALGAYDNVPILRNNLAANHFEAGRYDEALRYYEPLVEQHDQPYLRLIALARSAMIHARSGREERVRPLLDAALASLADTDYPVAHGSVAVAVLRYGDDAQVARLWALVPDRDAGRLPSHLRAEYEAAKAARPE
jgi:DNA-binding SARP family transcriptional activator